MTSWRDHGDAAYLDEVDLDRREYEGNRRDDAREPFTWGAPPPRRSSWPADRWAALVAETNQGPLS